MGDRIEPRAAPGLTTYHYAGIVGVRLNWGEDPDNAFPRYDRTNVMHYTLRPIGLIVAVIFGLTSYTMDYGLARGVLGVISVALLCGCFDISWRGKD